VAEGA
jgi:hypothetical protein